MRHTALGSTVAAFVLLMAMLPLSAQQQLSLPGIPHPKVNTNPPEIGKHGGTYVIATISDPRTFNPIVVTDSASGAITGVVFEGLVEGNYLTGDIEAALAEAWSVSPDSRTWTFTLRQGIRWSDGRPLTADDVIFSVQAIFTEGVDTSAIDLLTFDDKPLRYRRLDDRRVQFTTPTCGGLFLRLVGAIDVVPRHRLQDVLAKGGPEFNRAYGINTNPRELIGTGAFTLQSYVPGQRIVMLRNPTWWKVDRLGNRLPYLTRYVQLIVPSLEQSRLKFLAGETDIYGARAVEFAQLKAGERRGNYTVTDGPETFTRSFLVFNQNPAGLTPPKLTWFQDVRFRRALNQAIDRNTIIQQVLAGRGTPAWSAISPSSKAFHNPNVPQYPYNLERAQQLLAEAGYRKGADGLLRDAPGNVVEFTLTTVAGSSDFEAFANIVRQDFTKLGIRVTFAPESFPSLVSKLDGTYRWEAVVIALGGGIEEGTAGRNVWLSSGNLHLWRPKQEKAATEWEAEIDRIFAEILCEPDQNKRKPLYNRFQEIVASQAPLMFFAYPKTQVAVRNTLGNIKPGLGGAVGELETLYYKTAYR